MNLKDKSYLSILKIGLVSLREAGALGDSRRCQYEAEHLHNLPSLIGENNRERHLYYFNNERNRFIEEVRTHAQSSGNQDLLVNLALFVPHWDHLLEQLKE